MLEELLNYLHHPDWRRQQHWRRALWMNLHRVGLTGVYALPVNRRWIDIQRRAMPLAGLDAAFEGLKIAQLSDLHYSPVVWKRYLSQYIDFVNELKPDVVVVTGDLITGGLRYATRVAEILAALKAPMGVICTLGNHDYGIHGRRDHANSRRQADVLTASLRERGLVVLRNQPLELRAPRCRAPLVLVGLDDEWSGRIDPQKAWSGVRQGSPIICLNHNPSNVRELLDYPWQWMLSGHTHGRAVATSRIGRRLYAHRFRHYVYGYYSVEGRHLYVNRGLSYGRRAQAQCRPEITLFKLARAQ